MSNKRKRVLALLLTAAVMLAVPVIGASAADLEFGTDGKVTNVTELSFLVGPDSDTNGFFTDIKTAKVQVDLYKVADAVQETVATGESGHGSMYVYQPLSAYTTDLPGITTYAGLKGKSNDSWRTMAQNVANRIFAGTAPTPDYTYEYTTSGTVGPKDVAAGLYLVIAHGSGMSQAEYVLKDSANNVKTIANSDIYVYTYTPELISLPTTAATMGVAVSPTDGADPYATYSTYTDEHGKEHPGISTAGGDWKTSLTAMLKPVREYRFGKLVVRKTVPAIEEHSDATFVFHVIGRLTRNGQTSTVYDDHLSITFRRNEGGTTKPYYEPVTKEYYIELPVGTEVTVEEVYSGSCYKYAGQNSGIGKLDKTTWQVVGDVTAGSSAIPVPYAANGDAQALVFTTVNEYKPKDLHIGYGIQNTFEVNGSSWLWYKDGQLMNGGTN